MMDAQSSDRAKQACLKQSFGPELSADERELLDRFLACDAGVRYQQESGEMKRLLGEVADVEMRVAGERSVVDSTAMVEALEAMVRDELRTGRRRLPLALLLSSGIGLLTGGLCLQSGREHLVFFGWTMIGLAPICAILLVAVWCKQGAWLRDPDVLTRLEEEQRAGESPVAVFLAAVLGALLLAVLAVGVTKAGGLGALGFAVVVDAVVIWICISYRRRRRARHQELWDWWYGRLRS